MTPEDILAQAPKVLSQDQRESYFADGYLVLDGFVSAGWMDRLWDVTNGFIEQSKSISQSDGTFDLERDHSAEHPRLRRLSRCDEQHPVYWEFASRGPIVDIAEDLLGPDVMYHHSKLNFKWSGGGEEVKWHQDFPFYPHTNYSMAAIGLYMADVDDQMGPMGVIPGSHRGDLYNHYDDNDQWLGAIGDADAAQLPTDKAAFFTGRRGTVTVHHCRAVHGSRPNLSDRMRPLLINNYSSADALPVTPHPLPGPHVGAIVRGQRARMIQFDPRPCRNPPDWSGGYSSIFALQQQDEVAKAAE